MCDLDMFSAKKNSSNFWQGIVKNAKHVRQGTRFNVRNGRHTLFWDYYWAFEVPLSNMTISPIPVEHQDKTVEEYWNTTGNGNWKWDELSTFLSPDSLKVIASYYVSSSCEDEDSVYWGGSSIGKFSVKSAISLIRNEDDPQCDKKWDVMWKATVSEHIKMFLWLAVHDRLLMHVQRVTRKLTNDPRCTRCGADEESLDHILRRCPSSFMIWNKLGTHPPRSSFWTLPLCEWIMDNLSTSHAKNDSKGQIMFAITLWWLWK
nr:LURP1-like domain-containing protein [Tanacetum cinerariifolium]